jgi:hypothetical protein
MVWMLLETQLLQSAKDLQLEVPLWFLFHFMEASCTMPTWNKA